MNLLPRLLKLPVERSLFLFGDRNTGKSTFVEHYFDSLGAVYFDLLNQTLEQQLQMRAEALYEMVQALPIDNHSLYMTK